MGLVKFPTGRIVATKGVMESIPDDELTTAIQRHVSGDWGDVCEEDKESNNSALKNGERLLSSYKSKDDIKFWIITEWDRSVTTFLLPEEY